MAVNETIVTGRKFRKLIDAANKQWQRISFWHKASDCEFNDGKTAETKLGAIDGITSDLSGESETVAASIKCVNQLNDSLGGLSFYEDETGKYVVGADSVPKKLGSGSTIINLIIHQVGSGFVPITTAPNLYTSGIIINKDEGAFTLQNTTEFVCNTDGELVVFGWVSNANNLACTFSVVKNGNEISVPIIYSKGNTTIEVSKGDVLKFKFGVPAGYWIAGTFAIAL